MVGNNRRVVSQFFEAGPFESRYPHMVEFAGDGVIPERVVPSVLDVEVELCLMERGVDFLARGADLIRKCWVEVIGDD